MGGFALALAAACRVGSPRGLTCGWCVLRISSKSDDELIGSMGYVDHKMKVQNDIKFTKISSIMWILPRRYLLS